MVTADKGSVEFDGKPNSTVQSVKGSASFTGKDGFGTELIWSGDKGTMSASGIPEAGRSNTIPGEKGTVNFDEINRAEDWYIY